MAIGSVNARESGLGRASEVKCVSCPEKNRGRQVTEAQDRLPEEGFVHWVPLPETAATISFELVAQQMKIARIDDALTELTMENGDHLRFAKQCASNTVLALSKGDNIGAIRLGEIKLGDIAGIKVDYRPSRISETISVESVPSESLAWSSANPGSNRRD